MTDRDTMRREIAETSFLLDDLRLYLDTHPLDENALTGYTEYGQKRRLLLKEYAGRFEPLTCDCICLETNGSAKHWTWCDGPVPWDTEASAWAAEVTGRNAGQPLNPGGAAATANRSTPAAAAGIAMKGGQ